MGGGAPVFGLKYFKLCGKKNVSVWLFLLLKSANRPIQAANNREKPWSELNYSQPEHTYTNIV